MLAHISPSNLVLGLVIARLPAVSAVKLAVLGEANPVIRLAQRAILDARAQLFGLIANQAMKLLVCHSQVPHFQNRNSDASIVPPCADKIKRRQAIPEAAPQHRVTPWNHPPAALMFCSRTFGRQGIKYRYEAGRQQIPNFPRGRCSHARLLPAAFTGGALGDSFPAASYGA